MAAQPLVAPGQRHQRRERDGQQPGAAPDRAGTGPQQLGERERLGPGHVVERADRGGPLRRGQHGGGHIGHVDRLVQAGAGAGDRQHGRPPQQPQQPGQVAVAGIAVDHRRPQDRPVQTAAADLLLRGQPDLLGRRVQGRRHRGRRDEDRPRDASRLGGGDDGRAVTEAQRGQADQDLAAGRGERLV